MPLRRRDRQTPDPPKDREMPRGRGRQVPNLAMEREIRDIHARLEDMETTQRCTYGVGDVSEYESEYEARHEREEVTAEDAVNERLIRAVARMGAREKMDILVYEGNLDAKEILDWIRALDTYFDYEDVEEYKKVKHVVTRLKGHAELWWDELQDDRHCKGKQKIKSWDRMITKMKEKFIPRDY
jgi:Icc-related predicted phosphoesterase